MLTVKVGISLTNEHAEAVSTTKNIVLKYSYARQCGVLPSGVNHSEEPDCQGHFN